MGSRFDSRYSRGILEALPQPKPPRVLRKRRTGVQREARPPAAFALRGCVLTPDAKIDPGYVVVEGTTIAEVRPTEPSGVTVHETDGVILPGLIDLHGHPEFNVFAAWEPPKTYVNRYAWRGSDEYKAVLRAPWERLTAKPSLLTDLTRYAEARALVGGVTAIQGASADYADPTEALVRNVDLNIFGRQSARSRVDLDGRLLQARAQLRAAIDSGEVTAFYIHLAEGQASNERSRAEFTKLENAGLLTAATVIIHGTALTDDQLGRLKDAGGKLVWSPQSNLRLYGETTPAVRALELGIPMGLGADWLPSGSPSLLAELKVARERLVQQGVHLSEEALSRKLVRMVTADAAAIAGFTDKLGHLAAGRPADVTVLERSFEDPWRNVVEAEPSWVELVMIDGFLVYGRADWMDALAPNPELEAVIAWGKPMKLDTSFAVRASGAAPVRLADLRERLLGRYLQTGPIFA
jgi:cytosine/adenosine deaminase-related metal-dependent hydrolase